MTDNPDILIDCSQFGVNIMTITTHEEVMTHVDWYMENSKQAEEEFNRMDGFVQQMGNDLVKHLMHTGSTMK